MNAARAFVRGEAEPAELMVATFACRRKRISGSRMQQAQTPGTGREQATLLTRNMITACVLVQANRAFRTRLRCLLDQLFARALLHCLSLLPLVPPSILPQSLLIPTAALSLVHGRAAVDAIPVSAAAAVENVVAWRHNTSGGAIRCRTGVDVLFALQVALECLFLPSTSSSAGMGQYLGCAELTQRMSPLKLASSSPAP